MDADWQQTRLIVYTVACTVTEPEKRKDIYDFMPLPGDPTPARRRQMEEERRREQQEMAEAMIAEMRAHNEELRNEIRAKQAMPEQ